MICFSIILFTDFDRSGFALPLYWFCENLLCYIGGLYKHFNIYMTQFTQISFQKVSIPFIEVAKQYSKPHSSSPWSFSVFQIFILFFFIFKVSYEHILMHPLSLKVHQFKHCNVYNMGAEKRKLNLHIQTQI